MNYKLNSTVDWCEENYKVSEYIAEFWNTVTGLCLILSGVIFYVNKKQLLKNITQYYDNFFRICILLVVVGIGTMLFHGTLYYPFQLLDELPMIVLANEYLTVLVSLQTTQFTIKNIDPYFKVLQYTYNMLPVIIGVYFIHPQLQTFMFHTTLKISEISVLIILYKLSKGLNYTVYSKIYEIYDIVKKNKNKNCIDMSVSEYQCFSDIHLIRLIQSRIKRYLVLRNQLKTFIRVGVYIYSSSIVLWLLEKLFCNSLQQFQLHAIWHVSSSIGIYYLNNIILLHVVINKFAHDEL